jgi:hypothetical protein
MRIVNIADRGDLHILELAVPVQMVLAAPADTDASDPDGVAGRTKYGRSCAKSGPNSSELSSIHFWGSSFPQNNR